jgi:hypothetical protein
MRNWGPNIVVDGAPPRDSAGSQPVATAPGAEAYESRTEEVLRQMAGNPAGRILLDGFDALPGKVVIRPPRAAVTLSLGRQAGSNVLRAGRPTSAPELTLWYDSARVDPVAMQVRDPGHRWNPDDMLFHECVHAMRQILGVWRQAPMPEWRDREEFHGVMMTNIYLSRGGREADMRGDHGAAFKPLAPSLRYAVSSDAHDNQGRAFASKYKQEILSLRSEMFGVYLEISKMPLGWNPLRETERHWGAGHDFSSALPLSR